MILLDTSPRHFKNSAWFITSLIAVTKCLTKAAREAECLLCLVVQRATIHHGGTRSPYSHREEAEGEADACAQLNLFLAGISGPQHYSMEWYYPSRASLPTYQPHPANPQVILRLTTINCP